MNAEVREAGNRSPGPPLCQMKPRQMKPRAWNAAVTEAAAVEP
jgi:hypothetical protein